MQALSLQLEYTWMDCSATCLRNFFGQQTACQWWPYFSWLQWPLLRTHQTCSAKIYCSRHCLPCHRVLTSLQLCCLHRLLVSFQSRRMFLTVLELTQLWDECLSWMTAQLQTWRELSLLSSHSSFGLGASRTQCTMSIWASLFLCKNLTV